MSRDLFYSSSCIAHTYISRILSILLGGICVVVIGCEQYSFSQNRSLFPLHHGIDQASLDQLTSDSLRQEYDKLPDSDSKGKLALKIAEKLRNYGLEEAIGYAQSSLSLFNTSGNDFQRAKAHYWLGLLKRRKAISGLPVEDPLVDTQVALSIFNRLDKPLWKAKTYDLMGIIFNHQNRHDSAVYYLSLALVESENILNHSKDSGILVAEILHDFGANHLKKNSLDSALMYCMKSKEMYKQQNNQEGEARLNMVIGEWYLNQGDYPTADHYFRASHAYAKAKKDIYLDITCTHFLGKLYLLSYNGSKKDSLLDLALQTFKQNLSRRRDGLYYEYSYLGYGYQLKWMRTSDSVDYDSSMVYYRKAIEDASKNLSGNNLENVFNNIYYMCKSKGNCHRILKEAVSTYTGTLESAKVLLSENLDDLHQFRLGETEKRLGRRQRNTIYIALGVLFLGLLLGTLLYQIQKSHNLNRLLEARLVALRAQMNPHFIGNSLNAIESLVKQHKEKEASRYIVKFSRLSRMVLDNSEHTTITLAKELEALQYYLELEKLRYGDQLDYHVEVGEGIDPISTQFPPMVLQPYIENAIWHGIHPKETPGTVWIHISQEREQGLLVCSIKDNGIGREKSQQLKKSSHLEQESKGMKITEERIAGFQQMKGSKVDVIDLTDDKGQAEGTQIIITLPLLT